MESKCLGTHLANSISNSQLITGFDFLQSYATPHLTLCTIRLTLDRMHAKSFFFDNLRNRTVPANYIRRQEHEIRFLYCFLLHVQMQLQFSDKYFRYRETNIELGS